MKHSELKTEKWIVFSVADYAFALPIGAVLQIVNRPETNHELRKAGLVPMGRYMIPLLDLHRQLQQHDGVSPSEDQPFLLITGRSPGEFCAIPVSEPPNLVEFSLEQVQVLPQPNGQSGPLSIARYAVTVSLNEVTTTIFLLDLNRMLRPTTALVASTDGSV